MPCEPTCSAVVRSAASRSRRDSSTGLLVGRPASRQSACPHSGHTGFLNPRMSYPHPWHRSGSNRHGSARRIEMVQPISAAATPACHTIVAPDPSLNTPLPPLHIQAEIAPTAATSPPTLTEPVARQSSAAVIIERKTTPTTPPSRPSSPPTSTAIRVSISNAGGSANGNNTPQSTTAVCGFFHGLPDARKHALNRLANTTPLISRVIRSAATILQYIYALPLTPRRHRLERLPPQRLLLVLGLDHDVAGRWSGSYDSVNTVIPGVLRAEAGSARTRRCRGRHRHRTSRGIRRSAPRPDC